jgi:hypothetical protein
VSVRPLKLHAVPRAAVADDDQEGELGEEALHAICSDPSLLARKVSRPDMGVMAGRRVGAARGPDVAGIDGCGRAA